MITRPVDPQAIVDTHGYLSACEWLHADAAADIVAETDRVLGDSDAVARLEHWVRHYFGDTTPGAATARFHAAIERLMAEWDTWHERALDDDEEDLEHEDESELDD
jgi:hypothetical protein